MPRPNRNCPDGVPQHIFNRGNRRSQVFRNAADYLGFLAALTDAANRTVVRLLAFCLMPNHWHLVVWPVQGVEVSTYMQVVMNAHLRDLQHRHETSGTGHVYQGRFKNSSILTEPDFFNVCRYVESNALTAGLVQRAEQWEWSSLARSGPADGINILSPWPVARPANWLEEVNRPQTNRAVREIKKQLRRQRRPLAL
jgi:REP-associated tyrosine transposase